MDAAQVVRRASNRELIDTLRLAFLSPPVAPPRTAIGFGPESADTLLLMPAIDPRGLIGIKIVTVHPKLCARGGGAVRAIYIVLNAETGDPIALVDGQALTERRTAAASVLAALTLARPDSAVVLVVGTGQIAEALCRCYSELFAPRSMYLWGRRHHKAVSLASRLAAEGVTVIPVTDLESAISAADIITVATLASEPLILGEHVRPGTHVDLVGGFAPHMREADDALITRASVFVDGAEALATAGDLLHPIKTGALQPGSVHFLADVLGGRHRGRRRADEVTVFKSVGLALEDLAAARLLLDNMHRVA
jgi:ornithine cyclodeaminase